MKRLWIVFALGVASLCFGAASSPAIAQELRNNQIDIEYDEPSNPAYEHFYKGLQARKVLEELRAFLSPLKLPQKILIKVAQCNKPIQVYRPGEPVVICYEYIDKLNQLAAEIPADGKGFLGVTRDDAVVGAFIQTTLQQTSSAVFDVLKTPIWGREQDAADKLAAYLMLQFGPEVAKKLIRGSAYFFEASAHTWTGSDFSDVEAPEYQRYYNYLCIAYGSDPHLFAEFKSPDTGGLTGKLDTTLPEMRIGWCPREYSEETWAFETEILPHVDLGLLRKVLARDWLKPYQE